MKVDRLRASSPDGTNEGWSIRSLIAKSNDDLRQEVFIMQLITYFHEIFKEDNVPAWLFPYRILSTSSRTVFFKNK